MTKKKDNKPTADTKPISPVAAEIRKFIESAQACTCPERCHPLVFCPTRDATRS